ncbi:MAG: hypothetical protein ABIS43_09225 [Opitutus sp.]
MDPLNASSPLGRQRMPTNAKAGAFLVAFACAALFAVFTRHAWEDYYITYRASKHLATGQGLVFNVGDRLHTFTSPIGVLLPALASLFTLNRSDDGALWIFRLMSCVAFGGAAVLLFASLRRSATTSVAAALLGVAFLCTDAKSVDFSINGMETGFMLLFLAYAIWAQLAPLSGRRWVHLGVAWGGLMWTRPDSFIYIGLLAGGAWIFNDAARSGLNRKQWLAEFGKAGLLCAALYLPWFITAWVYYGSPVPHTIVAKASISSVTWSASSLLTTLVKMPKLIWQGASTIDAAFLPTYYVAGGWPQAAILSARLIGAVTACLWFLPYVRAEIRAASLAFLGAHVYLTFFPYFPFPWYLPPTALLAFFAWAALAGQFLDARSTKPSAIRTAAVALLALVAVAQLGVQTWLIAASAQQMAALQAHIDSGNRRPIGEWLAHHAETGDRVFLEPLGYIGYFSGLKTYDWPGLSSREVVEAHAKVGAQWARIVEYLGPDWLVLRPREVEEMQRDMPHLLTGIYEKVRDFDVLGQVEKLSVRGRRLLEMDAIFTVYHRKNQMKFPTDMGDIQSRYPGSTTPILIDNVSVRLVHAPGSVTLAVPAGAQHVRVPYAFRPGAAEGDPVTDGAAFQVVWVEGDRQEVLLYRELDPVRRASDRAVFTFDGPLPHSTSGRAQLILRSIPGKTDTKDWTCWGRPEFR